VVSHHEEIFLLIPRSLLRGGFIELMNFIKNTEKYSIEDHEYFFPNDGNKKAKVTFWYPKKLSLSHLTLGTSGDMNTVEVSGISAGQIKGCDNHWNEKLR